MIHEHHPAVLADEKMRQQKFFISLSVEYKSKHKLNSDDCG